jgi:cobalt-zinc-cadmium efflux system protein
LQGVPEGIDLEAIERQILEIDHVQSRHHTHIWSLEGEHHVFTSHLRLEHIDSFDQILKVKEQVQQILKQYHFEHYTIQMELDGKNCDLLQQHEK